jgi:ribosome-associated heat shock protein Hsp15
MATDLERLRIDKWLWAARFFKTRSLAAEEVSKGRVLVDGQAAKPAKELKAGDMLTLRQGAVSRTVQVRALSAVRGGAPQAQLLYQETEESIQARERAAEQRRMGVEPALAQEHGRPTKKDRRDISKEWDDRWSAY